MGAIKNLVYRWKIQDGFDCTPFIVTSEEVTEVGLGYLYNWASLMHTDNITNVGWEAPELSDYQTLNSYIGTDVGKALKESGTIYWNNDNGLNTSGFNGRGSGRRTSGGGFTDLNFGGNFLTITECTFCIGGSDPYIYLLGAGFLDTSDDFFAGSYSPLKTEGLSIRLLKTTTILSDGETGTYIGNDGKVYGTICIGTQEWLSENLKETKYRNENLIPEITDNTSWENDTVGARCSYNNDENNA